MRKIRTGTVSTLSGVDGNFKLNINYGTSSRPVLSIILENYQPLTTTLPAEHGAVIELGNLMLLPGGNNEEDIVQEQLPTINVTLEGLEEDASSNSIGINGLLGATRDPFLEAAAFKFSAARFRIRGLNTENSELYLNGLPFNDLESGRVFFGQFGGLNRVTNGRLVSVGVDANEYGFGGIGGLASIDLRARSQQKQTRASYAISNRTYRHRIMGVHSSGLNENGWAYTISGSRRWADEGYIEGTSYDAYSYFLSVDKVFNDRHALNFVGFGTPSKRGRSSASVQEIYDLTDNNFYNPNWGFQNGEKRNARIANYHQPVLMLRHDFTPTDRWTVTTAMGYQFGRGGSTALDWFAGPDPRPDYYRKLPSFADPLNAERVAEAYRTDTDVSQIDWDRLYTANRNSLATIRNVNGIEGNDITGNRALYVVEDRRNDVRRFTFNTRFQVNVTDHSNITGGMSYQAQSTRNFKVLEDLLGAEFYVDIDRFAVFDAPPTSDFVQNDLSRRNRLVREGDVFGYDYNLETRQGEAWLQFDEQGKKIDYFFGASVGFSKFFREGAVQNGRFPVTSLGKSPRSNFMPYALKAGATYKIDGRNYLVFSGSYRERAPLARNAFASPRTRNQIVDNLSMEQAYGVEGGYILRTPSVKARFMGYYNRIDNELQNRSLFLDNAIRDATGATRGGFVNYITNGLDTEYRGLEIAAEVKITPSLSATGVAALGQYTYQSRPIVTTYLDNFPTESASRQVFIKNFFVAGTPQTAGSFGLNYRSPKYWFLNVNVNYFDDIYADIFYERRTLAALSRVPDPQFSQEIIPEGSALYDQIIDQEKFDSAITVDLFGGKSFKIDDHFIYFNIGVNNILDVTDFRSGGFEQSRFDFEGKDVDRFPNRYFYSFGRNYFVSLAFKL